MYFKQEARAVVFKVHCKVDFCTFLLQVYEVTIIAEDEDSFDEDTEITEEVCGGVLLINSIYNLASNYCI